MDILMLIGLIILIIVYRFDRGVLKFDFKAVKSFMALMTLFTFFRLTIASLFVDMGVDIFSINQGFNRISFWKLALVFWEDAFFAITIYYMIDRWDWSKYVWMPIVGLLSIIFGIGHMYQGEWAFFVMLFIPYFIFYRAGRKFGFGTSMTCHILFDMFTLITFKMAPFLVY